jgi:DNA-binding NarL/FixJ family response regulator
MILNRSSSVEASAEWQGISADRRAIVFADEPTTRHLVTQVLDRCGAMVIAETDNVPNMLEIALRAKPEIVVLGLSVKGAHNITVVSEIRRRSPRSAIVVYSARERWRNKTLTAGTTVFVLHPRIHELAVRLQQLASIP